MTLPSFTLRPSQTYILYYRAGERSAGSIPLPKMLDRYFYPADLFSFVAAIFIPELWFIAIFFQISSGMAYTIFTLGTPPLLALPGALINTALVVIIIRNQLRALKQPASLIENHMSQEP
jgi:hypothetical protein